MARTAFALLAVAALAKSDLSGRHRLSEACAGILRGVVDEMSESRSQRLAPVFSAPCARDALAVSGMGAYLIRDVMPG
jgi:hypothetical protein